MGIRLQNILRAYQETSRQGMELNKEDANRFSELYHKYYTQQEELTTDEAKFLANLEITLANELDL